MVEHVKEEDAAREDVGTGFLNLCMQYEQMGRLLKLQSKILSHPLFSKSTAPAVMEKMLEQYYHMGQQLKVIGVGLDAIGASPPPDSMVGPVFANTGEPAPRDIGEVGTEALHRGWKSVRDEEEHGQES